MPETDTVESPTTPTARTSAARERILQTAGRLFYNEGIRSVGVHRIVKEAAVTRVTLYRHFPSKDDLISAYLERRAQYDRDQIEGLIAARPDEPRQVLAELATVLTQDDFAAMTRGCPFVNACAEFTVGHTSRTHAETIRAWVTQQLELLLTRVGHATPRLTAQQLMMVRTGAVVSGALDHNQHLNNDFLDCWNHLIESGLPRRGKKPA
jgi:AcrR family transcriptional regulator